MNGKINIDQLKIKEEYRSLVPRPTKDERASILASMQENGFDYAFPMIVNQDYVVLDGHTRYDVAKELGIGDIFIIAKNFDGNICSEMMFVIESNIKRRHLNLAQKCELALVIWELEARKAEMRMLAGGYPQANLAVGLEDSFGEYGESREIAARKVGVAVMSLRKAKTIKEVAKINNYIKDRWEYLLAGGQDDTLDSIYQTVKRQEYITDVHKDKETKREIFSDISLYYADCFNILPKLSNINLAVIDPPYNITANEWDNIGTREEYLEWMRNWMQLVKNILSPEYHLFLFCHSQYMARIEIDVMERLGLPVSSRIIWIHGNTPSGRTTKFAYQNKYDVVLHTGNHILNFDEHWSDDRRDIQEFALPQANYVEDHGYHPTQKPLELVKRFVMAGSKDGDSILDCFAGSGTLGEACNDVGNRKCILIENKQEYIDVIQRRCPNAKRI